MNKAWVIVVDVVIGIFIILFSVMVYFGLRKESVLNSLYRKIADEFITDVKKTGVLTSFDYEKLIKKLEIGNNIFDISFEHRYKVYEPEYRFRTLEEIIEEQNKNYAGSNEYHYREVITERPHVDDPVNNGNLNSETNESVLENAENLPPDPNHIHQDECYRGTKHIHTGSPTTGGGCYGQAGICNALFSISSTWNAPQFSQKCNRSYMTPGGDFKLCTGTVYTDKVYHEWQCANGHSGSTLIFEYTRCNGECGYVYQYSIPQPGRCTESIHVLNCNKTEGKYYDENGNESDPVCGQIVVSLTPTHVDQTVYINDPLITTATVTYLDGSTRVIVCATDFETSVLCNNQEVVLRYEYKINGETFYRTCKIYVTVIPRGKTCPKGHLYNLNEDGSDPGCPYCRAWVESIEIIHPSSSPIVITIGTTLKENGVILLATYMDGHTEEVSSGYEDNLDRFYFGHQVVTIGYKGVTISVLVITVRATIVCDICGYTYELYPDGTNPGCPRCIQKTPVFTGNVMEYTSAVYTNEILEAVYKNGKYAFNVNDEFILKIENRSSSITRNLLRKIYPSLSDKWFLLYRAEYIMAK